MRFRHAFPGGDIAAPEAVPQHSAGDFPADKFDKMEKFYKI
jgi:hypothetical protein